MAFTITGSLIVDETTGKQNGAPGADTTGNDVVDGLGAVGTTVTAFDNILSAVVTQSLAGVNVSVAVSGCSSIRANCRPAVRTTSGDWRRTGDRELVQVRDGGSIARRALPLRGGAAAGMDAASAGCGGA